MNDPRGIQTHDHSFEDDGRIPNNPTLPLLVYPHALSEAERGLTLQSVARRKRLGRRLGGRRLPYRHYHSVSHEVLCVVGVAARVTFGGPEGETLEVRAGDVVVIPAGVGHCNEGSDVAFSVVGAYPHGQENYDLRTGEPGERPGVLEYLRNVPVPESDPLLGEEGPLLRHWIR